MARIPARLTGRALEPPTPRLVPAFLQRRGELASPLVLLDLWPLRDLEREVQDVPTFLTQGHSLQTVRDGTPPAAPPAKRTTEVENALLEGPQRFQDPLGQFRWYWGLVCQDPHPGNLQAVGQYGKVLVAAAPRHMEGEAQSPPNWDLTGPKSWTGP